MAENRLRFLVIAPYEGMRSILLRVAEEFPQIDLTVFVGDLQRGVEIAKDNFHGNYDAVISRGGTATLLRQQIQLPVIDIEVSMYDLMCSLTLAASTEERIAIVSFPNIIRNARLLCDIMNYDIDLYTIDDADEVKDTLKHLVDKRYQTILCDVIADTTARRMGLHSILITSGTDSIRHAFEEAIRLCGSQQHLRDENAFFRALLNGQIGQTIVVDDEGKLFLTTLKETPPELKELLLRELPESIEEEERKFVRILDGTVYTVRSRRITSGSLTLTAFFFVSRRTVLSPNQVGIRYYSRMEAEESFCRSAFNYSGLVSELTDELERIEQSKAPIMIAGENGTGKESLVEYIYVHSSLGNNPLVTINCGLLNDKSWTFLLEHHNSPLADQNETIYFSGMDLLPAARRQQLLAALSEMGVCRRNRVLFSCVCQQEERVSAAGSLFMDKLSCLYLYLPPLRRMKERIPSVFKLILSHLNEDLSRQIVSASPEALTMLQEFQWPYNYTQFRRVVEELTVVSDRQVVTAEDVETVLAKEYHVGAFGRQTDVSGPLDLNRTMDEINQEIAQMVLEETGGNRSLTAERLGISRTTLWRLLKKREERNEDHPEELPESEA